MNHFNLIATTAATTAVNGQFFKINACVMGGSLSAALANGIRLAPLSVGKDTASGRLLAVEPYIGGN